MGCSQQSMNGTSSGKKSSTEEFTSLGKDDGFAEKHDEPGPYTHTGEGKMITFKTSDGKDASAFEIKAKGPSEHYLFVFHEWWGLNDHIKKEAEKLHGDLENVNVLALDLYDGNVASTREKAQEYMQKVTDSRARAIIKGALNYVPQNTRVATIGWCFGGGWSLQAAIISGANAVGCVMYYGMPEDDEERLKKLNTDVLAIFAQEDEWITPEVVEEFKANMEDAGEELEVEMFDAGHAFANPSNPHYKEDAAEKAYDITLKYLKGKFNETME